MGHPAAGNRWEGKMDQSVTNCAFEKAPGWKGVYRQSSSEAALGVYVDDFELMASPEDTPRIWRELEKHIEFGDEHTVWGEKPTRHLGCQYGVEQVVTKIGDKETTIKALCQIIFWT